MNIDQKDCRIKHSYLKKIFENRLEFQKNRRANKKNKRIKQNKEKKKKKENEVRKAKKKKKKTYNAVETYISYFTFATTMFFKLVAAFFVFLIDAVTNAIVFDIFMFWFFDIDAFYYITNNRNVFIFFIFIFSRIVDNIDENLKIKEYDFVRLFCKKDCSFTINNVFYIKNCFYNLLSFNQFHNNSYFLFIIKNKFFIDINNIQALFRCNLYFV